MKKHNIKLIGIIGQWMAVLTTTSGLTYEVITGAHFGFVLITAGALAFAVFTKIKYSYSQDD